MVVPPAASRRPGLVPLAVFGGAAVVLWLVVGLVSGHAISQTPASPFPGSWFLAGWAYDDGGWYRAIADHGYWYIEGQQSPVAFFPAYPLLMRAGGYVVGDVALAGVLLALACGAASMVLFLRWCSTRLSPAASVTACALLALYPYAWYLYGAIYSDALFLVGVLGAFLLLERDRPVLAGLVAAVSTAARPLGPAVAIGLLAVLLQRRGILPAGQSRGERTRRQPLRPGDAGVLLSLGGLVGYMTYLWVRFDAPLAFAEVQSAPGWDQGQGPHTWFKVSFFGYFVRWHDLHTGVRLIPHALVAVAAVLLVPRIARRLGWGYAIYTLVIVAIPAVGSKDFMGTARYLLAAFPCFAVAGEVLADRPRLRTPVLVVSAVALAGLTSLHARGVYIS